MRSPKALWIAGLLVLVVISLWKALNVYTEWLWISQVGYASVFVTIYKARLVLLLVVGAVLFFWLWGNCRIARRSTSEDITFIGKRLLPPAERAAIEQHIDKAIIIVTLLVAVVGAILASHRALPLLQFMNSTSFTGDDGTVLTDPIFGREMAFYVFRLPFIEYVYGVIFNAVIIALVLAALVYLYEEGLRVVPGTLHLAPHVRRHLFSLLAAAFAIRAVGFWLDRFKLLTSQGSGERVYGIGYTDLYARIPVYWFLIVVALVCAVVAIVAIRRLSVRAVGMALAALILFAVLGRWAAPAVVQAIVVKPSEIGREREFLAHNIKYTRDAYGLSRVSEEHHDVTPLTAKEIAANPATIDNLRLWDDRPLETAANRMASLRTYYEFADVDIDRYVIDGKLRQVMLSGRQLNVQNLKPEIQTWVNTHMQYTHGYGLALAPVNEIGEGGRPNFIVKDIPPRYPPGPGLEKLAVPPERAGLYYQVAVEREPMVSPPAAAPGESAGEEAPPPDPGTRDRGPGPTRRGPHLVQRVKTTTDFCIVGAVGDEFDYPRAIAAEAPSPDSDLGGNVMTRYLDEGGKGGVPISGFFRRFAFFARFRSWPLLFSSDITNESRILMHRTVYERISAIAPFLALDWDPYLVIAEEKLQWITDAYTVTDRYPYSDRGMIGPQKLNINYMRNSVKVCVDAYDGTVDFYVFDDQDAILQTFRKIFPDVFKDRTEMPGSLLDHIRYPEVLFMIQSQMYQLYHMEDVTDFYQQEDRWDFPDEEFAGRRRTIEAYYVVMTLPEGDEEGDQERDAEFLLMTPFTPYGKSDLNMLAWMCARCDPEHYGELIVYTFPKDRMIQGPMMVEVAIGADGEISEMETLWGGTGSTVIRGNLLVIPIENSILYLEPLYVQAVRSGIPELRIVVVGANEKIAWGATLDEALNKMFGPGAVSSAARTQVVGEGPAPAAAVSPEIAQVARQALDRYRRAVELRNKGDFVGYEEEQKKLGPLLQRLIELTESTPVGRPTAEGAALGD